MGSFPATDATGYVISLNYGVATVELDFDPNVPNGELSISSPPNQSVLGKEPSFTISSTCDNCDGLFAEVDNLEPFGALVEIEAEYGTPFPEIVRFPDFGENEGTEDLSNGLPEDSYEFSVEAYSEAMTIESFTPVDNFDYFRGAFRTDRIFFSVPEPGALQLGLGALMTLLFVRRSKHGLS